MNEIGKIKIRTSKPIVDDPYSQNRLTGSFILMEQGTNQTVAAGILSAPMPAFDPEFTDYPI